MNSSTMASAISPTSPRGKATPMSSIGASSSYSFCATSILLSLHSPRAALITRTRGHSGWAEPEGDLRVGHQLRHQVTDGNDPINPPSLRPAKDKPLFHPSGGGVRQGLGDAVGDLLRVAGEEAAVAAHDLVLVTRLQVSDKGIAKDPPGHSHRAVNERDIPLGGVHEDHFEREVGIALVGADEPTAELCSPRSVREDPGDVRAIEQPPRGDNRNRSAAPTGNPVSDLEHLTQQRVELGGLAPIAILPRERG